MGTVERPGRRAGQVRVRGTQDGLVMQIPSDLPFPTLLGQVRDWLDNTGGFYREAELAVDYGNRTPDAREITALQTLLAEHGVVLRGVTADSLPARELLRSWGYYPRRQEPHDSVVNASEAPWGVAQNERSVLYVRRTLRSGTVLRNRGHVVVLGDVNSGAEVYAGGDVIVWGAVRGTIHAGLTGDINAAICALRLVPTQLRIGKIVARLPDRHELTVDGPMLARVLNGEIVVEVWRLDRRSGR